MDTDIELDLQSNFAVTVKGTPEQLAGPEYFAENMKRRLARKPELLDQMLPSFPPGCRRLTPGPGYLEALTDDKVDVINTEIKEVDATGIRTADGKHRPVDMIVCATGFDTTYRPVFPFKGRNGVSLADKWKEFPDTYISLATDEFPNFFMCLGPNAALGHGSLLLLIEKSIDYMTECVKKMQRDNILWMMPRREAVERFTTHCEQYFTRTVFSTKCRSWYKGGREDGRVVALWPGMLPCCFFAHYIKSLIECQPPKDPHCTRSRPLPTLDGKTLNTATSTTTRTDGLAMAGLWLNATRPFQWIISRMIKSISRRLFHKPSNAIDRMFSIAHCLDIWCTAYSSIWLLIGFNYLLFFFFFLFLVVIHL